MDMEYQISVNNGSVFVSPFDEDIWLAIHGGEGHYRIILTRDEAKQIMEALQSVLNVAETK